ncbi:MAG: hypothetical protein KF850_20195 [Labilithrix sp.]|nr:hypothetical protein [Labilithrix sp.]
MKNRTQRTRSGPPLAALALASTLFGCAQIAGVEMPELSARASRSETRGADASEPAGGAVGDEDKQNTDSHAEGIEVTDVLDFGTVGCASERIERLLVANKTDKPRTYKVLMPSDAPFATDFPLEGMIPPNDHVAIPIVARPTWSGEAKANVVVTSGSSFATVPVGVIGAGATLEWMSTSADIGETPLDTEGTTRVRLRNTGLRPAAITAFAGVTSDFVATPGQLTIAPDSDAEIEVKLTKGNAPTATLSTTLAPVADGLCAPAPPVTVTGQRVNTTVTVSGAGWGKRDCNSEPLDTRAVVVRNYSNRNVLWSLLTSPSRFALQGGTMAGTTPASSNGTTPGTTNITFRAPPLGADPVPITETIRIAIDPLSGGDRLVHEATLSVDVRGAVVAIAPTALTFRARKGESSKSESFTITNTGNETASLAWAFLRTAGGPAWLGNPQRTSTSAGRTTTVALRYQPSTDPPNTAQLTPARSGGGRICNPAALDVVRMTGAEP